MPTKSKDSVEAEDVVKQLRKNPYDPAEVIGRLNPSALGLAAAVALYPHPSEHPPQENDLRLIEYLQVRVQVQASLEHQQAMQQLGDRIDAAQKTGQWLIAVGIGLAFVQAAAAIVDLLL